jgi:hypothetical protein
MKALQSQFQQANEDLHSRNEQLLRQQEAIRAAAAAELELAMKLIEQVPLPDTSQPRQHTPLRADTDPDPADETNPLEGEREEEIVNETSQASSPVLDESDPASIPVSKIQDAISLDKQLSAESPMGDKQSEESHPPKETNESPPQNSQSSEPLQEQQPHASRVSVSVFPQKKELVVLTPVPIVMNAQLLEFERPPSRKQRPPPPAPVETSDPIAPAVQPSPMAFPSPSAYLQHYDYRPATPELSSLEIPPRGAATSPAHARRSSDPVDYLTASQALEKQQRLSLRIQPVVAPDPTPPPGVSQNYDFITANSPYPPGSFLSPADMTKKTVAVSR